MSLPTVTDLLKANHEIWKKKEVYEKREKIAVHALEEIVKNCQHEPLALSFAKLALEKIKAIK